MTPNNYFTVVHQQRELGAGRDGQPVNPTLHACSNPPVGITCFAVPQHNPTPALPFCPSCTLGAPFTWFSFLSNPTLG